MHRQNPCDKRWAWGTTQFKKTLHYIVSPQCKPEHGKQEAKRSEEEQGMGFDYIEQLGQPGHVKNKQLTWVIAEVSNKMELTSRLRRTSNTGMHTDGHTMLLLLSRQICGLVKRLLQA